LDELHTEAAILSKKIADQLPAPSVDEGHGILLTPEHPEADVKHIVPRIVRSGLKAAPAKRSVSLRIDADVLDLLSPRARVIKRASILFFGRSLRLPANNRFERSRIAVLV